MIEIIKTIGFGFKTIGKLIGMFAILILGCLGLFWPFTGAMIVTTAFLDLSSTAAIWIYCVGLLGWIYLLGSEFKDD